MSGAPPEGKSGAPGGQVHGVLIVDKPVGMTSHDVVGHVRRAYRTRRVGHAGTLDPMATGVLVLLLGEATKLSSVLTTQSKEYQAVIRLGTSTDSLDADGRVTGHRPLAHGRPTGEELAAALSRERERSYQIPPAISAIKVDGKRSYKLARGGSPPAHEPREVRVHDLEVLSQAESDLSVRLRVSKGYYVRALARDLAAELGTLGHLTSLRRTQSGRFRLDQAVPLPLTAVHPLLSLADAVRLSLPSVEVDAATERALLQGKPLSRAHPSLVTLEALEVGLAAERVPPREIAAIHADELVALLHYNEIAGVFQVQRGFNPTRS